MKLKHIFDPKTIIPNKLEFTAKGHLVFALVTSAIMIPGMYYVSDKFATMNHGSSACFEKAIELNEIFDFAATANNELIIEGIKDEIEEYKAGRGESAPGDQCAFPHLVDRIQALDK